VHHPPRPRHSKRSQRLLDLRPGLGLDPLEVARELPRGEQRRPDPPRPGGTLRTCTTVRCAPLSPVSRPASLAAATLAGEPSTPTTISRTGASSSRPS
jgi:hypothetical protein